MSRKAKDSNTGVIEGLSLAVRLALRVHCYNIYVGYKVMELLCEKCVPDDAGNILFCLARCRHAITQHACWDLVMSGRITYLLSGCDFINKNNNFDGHADAIAGKPHSVYGKVQDCSRAILNNCF